MINNVLPPFYGSQCSVLMCFYIVLYTVSVHRSGTRLDEKLTPAPLADAAMMGNAVFDIPIVVIPGECNHTVMCSCLLA